jgi:hypothetical protein
MRMKKITKFCLKHQLISEEDADRIIYDSERESLHPIRTMERFGVDIALMYEKASIEYEVDLCRDETIKLTENRLDESVEKEFDLLTLVNEDSIKVMTWNFFQLNIIPRAIENITGKKVTVTLIPFTRFDTFS